MAFRMFVNYKPPKDAEQFEKRYVEGHLPLIEKYEKIQHFTINKVARNLQGEYPYAYTFIGEWASKEDWKHDLGSEAAKLATEDAASFATEGFDVVTLEELA